MIDDSITERTEIRDGMRIIWDAAIPMDDGIVLRADVFMPPGEGRYPVMMGYGPFAKGLSFQEGNPGAWEHLSRTRPEVLAGTSSLYQAWELVDPERWVPDGYACLRVDSRGVGCSPGFIDPWSPREAQDIYHCVEWAAAQPWSSGKVALNGISYYAINAWQAAALKPPHLSAIVAWEGAGDYYRETTRHGGILSGFLGNWFPRAVARVQHGLGTRGHRSQVHGRLVSGPQTLPEEVLAGRRLDVEAWMLERPLEGPDHRARSPRWDQVEVPLLSAANWGGQGLHTRGNFEGFVHAASTQKWLEAHGGAHWESFYTDYGVALQKKFLGHFLKGEDTGWDRQPRVLLQVRHVDRFEERAEGEWPLARTRWTRFYLDPRDTSLRRSPPPEAARMDYAALGQGLLFLSPPLEDPLEITGPAAAQLRLSSNTTDADVFLVLRVFTADGFEVTFQGANDPRVPISIGWLRASHRKLDPARSLPYRPWHAHDEIQPLTPGKPETLEVEIWPTCIVVPRGYRIGLSVRGCDYSNQQSRSHAEGFKYTQNGVGPFIHDHPKDRPEAVFGGTNTLHFEPGHEPYVLLPVIPPKD